MDKRPLIEQFAEYLCDTKHFSSYTARAYSRDVEQFLLQLTKTSEGGEALLLTATVDSIMVFDGYLRNQNYSTNSIKRKMASLKSFYKWLLTSRLIAVDPTARPVRLSTKTQTSSVLEHGLLLRLLAAPDTSSVLGQRDQTMILLICATGIKLSELIELRLEDVQLGPDPHIVVAVSRMPMPTE